MNDLTGIELSGARMRAARERRGLIGAEVARQLGITRGTVWNYEAGNATPSGDIVARMCKLYRCSVSALTVDHALDK